MPPRSALSRLDRVEPPRRPRRSTAKSACSASATKTSIQLTSGRCETSAFESSTWTSSRPWSIAWFARSRRRSTSSPAYTQEVVGYWPTGNLQPVEIARIRRWRDITPLYKLGRAQPGSARCPYGQGDAAFRRLYLDPERSGRWRSAPGVLRNQAPARSVGGRDDRQAGRAGAEVLHRRARHVQFRLLRLQRRRSSRKRPEELSWAELFNAVARTRRSQGQRPTGGLQDAANAAQAAGLMRFGDLGDPTRREIDRLVKLLLAYRKRGQFFNVWSQGDDPVDGCDREGRRLTMYASRSRRSPRSAFPVRQAAPREGYRAFAGLLSISNAVPTRRSSTPATTSSTGGTPASPARCSCARATTTRSRRRAGSFMPAGEYAYWLEGKPADQTYPGPSATVRREGPGARRRLVRQPRLPDLELELDAEAEAVLPRALGAVHLDLLGRLDGDPDASLADRDARRIGADHRLRSTVPRLRVDARDGAGEVVRRPDRALADGDADRPVPTGSSARSDRPRDRSPRPRRRRSRDPDPASAERHASGIERRAGSGRRRRSVRGIDAPEAAQLAVEHPDRSPPVTTAKGSNPTGRSVLTTTPSWLTRTSPGRRPSRSRLRRPRPSDTRVGRVRRRQRRRGRSGQGAVRFATKTSPGATAIEFGPAVVTLPVTSFVFGSIRSTD